MVTCEDMPSAELGRRNCMACRAKLFNTQQRGIGAADLCHLILPTGENLFTATPDLCSLLKSLARIW